MLWGVLGWDVCGFLSYSLCCHVLQGLCSGLQLPFWAESSVLSRSKQSLLRSRDVKWDKKQGKAAWRMMVKHGVWKYQLVQVSEPGMSHIRGEEVSSEWSRPGLVSCDLKFLLISALRWALFPNTAEGGGGTISDGSPWLPLPFATNCSQGHEPSLFSSCWWSQPDPAQLWLHRKRDWDVMATAPFPGKSSAVAWGFAQAFAPSLADHWLWWSHHDFSSLV